jgi:very-short-patch-repair endonuclease
MDELDFAIPRRHSARRGRWSQSYRVIPPEFVVRREDVAITAPRLTAVDLAATPHGGEAIDNVLRSRQATLDQLWEVLGQLPRRRGNAARAAMLRDSRDEPWSEGERLLHRLLREHRITGWTTNSPIHVGATTYFGDVVFERQRLIVEFDGWAYHGDRVAFENDRYRRNELEVAGYRVLNVTWRQVKEDPGWVIGCVRRGLGDRKALLEVA